MSGETLCSTASRPTFLFLHHNPLPIGNGLDAQLMLGEPMRLLMILNSHPHVRGVAFGHMHVTRRLPLGDIQFFCTPSPAFGLALEPAEKMITHSETAYRVFKLHDDGSIETWIRRVEEK